MLQQVLKRMDALEATQRTSAAISALPPVALSAVSQPKSIISKLKVAQVAQGGGVRRSEVVKTKVVDMVDDDEVVVDDDDDDVVEQDLVDVDLDGGDPEVVIRSSTASAEHIFKQVMEFGSAVQWVRITEWSSTRNKHECESLAFAIDALRRDGVSATSRGMEVLLRRLAGVQLADESGSWELCSAVEAVSRNSKLLSRADLASAIKEAERLRRLSAGTKSSSTRGKYQPNYNNKYKQGGNNYGNSNHGNNNNNYGGGNNYNKSKKARPAQEQKNANATGGSSN